MDYFPQHDDFHYNNFVSSSVTRVVKKETRIGVSMLRNRKDLIETHVKYFLCKHLCESLIPITLSFRTISSK